MVSPSALRTGATVLGALAIAVATPVIYKWEGDSRVGYFDIAQVPTACSGHTKTAVVGRRYTAEECRALLRKDIAEHATAIRPCVPEGTPVEVQAALLSLAFNIGPKSLCSSTVARRLRAGDLRGACDAILMWNKARVNGQLRAVQGLTNRRYDERALCLSGLR